MSTTYISYVPHGVNTKYYTPLDSSNLELYKAKQFWLNKKDYDFILFFNSRNIRRKCISDIIIAYKLFSNMLPKEKADKCLLLLKTAVVDGHGTDLGAIHQQLTEDVNIIIIDQKIPTEQLNILYNLVSVTLCTSSAEGFGLSMAESLAAGTPVIFSVIGGLQDQARFTDSEGKIIDFTVDHPTNSDGRYTECGEWALPVWTEQTLVGSPPTPYIYDSNPKLEDIVNQIFYAYNNKEKLKSWGLAGRNWILSTESSMSSEAMSNRFMNSVDQCFENFKPRNRFNIFKVEVKKEIPLKNKGIYNPLTKEWI